MPVGIIIFVIVCVAIAIAIVYFAIQKRAEDQKLKEYIRVMEMAESNKSSGGSKSQYQSRASQTQAAWGSPSQASPAHASPAQNPAQPASQSAATAVKGVIGKSLRDGDGGSAACAICGKRLEGFGRFGGFCSSCIEWDYDRGLYMLHREMYGPSAESLLILAAYENVQYRSKTGEYTGMLYVTPGSLIFTSGRNMRLILLFSDVSKVTATRGYAQQLTILAQGEEYASEYHNFDLQGSSYDGANYEDLLRIRRLIQKYAEAV